MRILIPVVFRYLQRGDASVLNSVIETLSKVFPNASFLAACQPGVDLKQHNLEMLDGFFPNSANRLVALWKRIVYFYVLAVVVAWYWTFKRRLNLPAKLEPIIMKAYAEADVVILPLMDGINSIYSFETLLGCLYKIFIAKILGKPVMLYAVHIGPFEDTTKGKICTFLTRLVLDRVDVITVRGFTSITWLKKMGVSNPRVYVTADPAFLLEPCLNERVKRFIEGFDHRRNPVIGINTSALLYRYGFLHCENLRLKFLAYVKLLSMIVDYLVEEINAVVILVPHSFILGDDDREVSEYVLNSVRDSSRVRCIVEEFTPEELKAIIGHLDLFVATRHHPFIHAISMHVPTIGIDYISKMKDTAAVCTYDEWVRDIKDLSYESLIFQINLLWSNREYVKTSLVEKARRMRKLAFLNANLLKDLVKCSFKKPSLARATVTVVD